MSKTFSNAGGNRDITLIDETHDHFTLRVREHITARSISVSFDADQAPALSLAILESVTGEWPTMTADMSNALHHLRAEVKRIEERTAEAQAQAELEDEALGLLNAYLHSADTRLYATWEEVVEVSKRMAEDWLAVARKAREMRAEK